MQKNSRSTGSDFCRAHAYDWCETFTTHARSGREYFDILLISSGIITIEMVMETIEKVVADLKSYQSTGFSPVSNNRAVMMAM